MADFETPAITLDEILKNLPPVDPALFATYFADAQALVAVGATIASSKVVTDTRRVYADAYLFWKDASPPQQQRLRGFSPELLAFAVAHAIKLRDLPEGGRDPVPEKRLAEGREAFTAALAARDQALRVLKDAAGADQARRDAADAAVGTADDSLRLATGLENLSALLSSWLAEPPQSPIALRLRFGRLDATYAADLIAMATDLRAKNEAAKTSATGRTAQVARDQLDGENIQLLGQVVRAFESAHDRDPSIPRLVPIATRRLLGRRRTEEKQPVPVADPNGPGNPVEPKES